MNVCVYEDLHGKKLLYTYGAILIIFIKKKKKKKIDSTQSYSHEYLLEYSWKDLESIQTYTGCNSISKQPTGFVHETFKLLICNKICTTVEPLLYDHPQNHIGVVV